jgi:hypothetical protein
MTDDAMTTSDESFPDSFIVQARCEMAAYSCLRPITWRLEQIAGLPSFSDFIDVRPGTDGLLVHERDPAEWAYLLVLYKDRPNYNLCGWLWGHEVKQPRFKRRGDDGLAAFFVPLDSELFHPAETLIGELIRRPLVTGRPEDGRLLDATPQDDEARLERMMTQYLQAMADKPKTAECDAVRSAVEVDYLGELAVEVSPPRFERNLRPLYISDHFRAFPYRRLRINAAADNGASVLLMLDGKPPPLPIVLTGKPPMNRRQLKRRWTVMLAIFTSPLRSETMLILPDRRLIAWEMLLKEGAAIRDAVGGRSEEVLSEEDLMALSEDGLMAPFAGMRIREETERAAALLALVDATAGKRFRARRSER